MNKPFHPGLGKGLGPIFSRACSEEPLGTAAPNSPPLNICCAARAPGPLGALALPGPAIRSSRLIIGK